MSQEQRGRSDQLHEMRGKPKKGFYEGNVRPDPSMQKQGQRHLQQKEELKQKQCAEASQVRGSRRSRRTTAVVHGARKTDVKTKR